MREGQKDDKPLERRIMHDINNQLSPIIGYSDLMLTDDELAQLLPKEIYDKLMSDARDIHNAGLKIKELIGILGRFYNAKGQGIEIVEASSLSLEENIYRVVHVDDEKETRDSVFHALTGESNLTIPSSGIFGHDGKRIRYELHSYESVDRALMSLPALEVIDLLITDREMPNTNGFQFLDMLTKERSLASRLFRRTPLRYISPEHTNIRNLAMLTGGITQQEAEKAVQTYGASVLTKPIQPLALEQQIYRIINPKPHQS